MSRKRPGPPPPDQPSIKSFIIGSSTSWKIGDSPLAGQKKQSEGSGMSSEQILESEIHESILAGGTFNFFKNQPAALSYLNGQIILRTNHSKKMAKMEKSVSNFRKSGLTQKFMKIPSKILPQDKNNCHQEVTRANKVLGDLKLFKEEMVILKKGCFDNTGSVIKKKQEEYEYYSDRVSELVTLTAEMEGIVYQLEKTNTYINQSRASKAVSIMENKRVKRRRKENRKSEAKDAFNRKVECLTKFLPKHTNKTFDDIFTVVKVNVPVPKNQFAKKRSNLGPSTKGIFDSKDEDSPAEEPCIIDSSFANSSLPVSSKASCTTTSSTEASCIKAGCSENSRTTSPQASFTATLSTETFSSIDSSIEASIIKDLPSSVVDSSLESVSMKSHTTAECTTTSSGGPSNITSLPTESDYANDLCKQGTSSAETSSAATLYGTELSPSSSVPPKENVSDEDLDENLNESEVEIVQNDGKQKKYRHEKIERKIEVKENVPKLSKSDFKKMEFVKQRDAKSLRILVELSALDDSVDKIIRSKISSWEMEDSDKLFLDICAEESENNESTENIEIQDEDKSEINVTEKEMENDDQIEGKNNNKGEAESSSGETIDKKTLKKKYKKLIKEVLGDNNNKMKKKKLKKKVLSLSQDFDKSDDPSRKEFFEKCLVKTKNIQVDGKYVSRNSSE